MSLLFLFRNEGSSATAIAESGSLEVAGQGALASTRSPISAWGTSWGDSWGNTWGITNANVFATAGAGFIRISGGVPLGIATSEGEEVPVPPASVSIGVGDIWSWNNAIDATGTIISSAAGSAGDLLMSNIRDARVGKIWRAATMPATLNIQLAATAPISIIGLFGVNFSELGNVTIRLGSSEGAADLFETSVNASTAARQAVIVLQYESGDLASVSASHVTVVATDGAPLEIGRIWIGSADWKPNIGHSPNGSGWQGQDLSQRSRTPRSGAFLIDRGARLRTFTANYAMLEPDDYSRALFEMDNLGLSQQMLFIPDNGVYDPNRFAVLGYLSEIPATNWQAFMTAGRTISIEEAG